MPPICTVIGRKMKKDKRLQTSVGKSGVAGSTSKGVPHPEGPRLLGDVRVQDEPSAPWMNLSSLEWSARTQGNRKALQRLDEMWQNEAVQAEFSEIRHIQDPAERGNRLAKFAVDHRLDPSVGAIFLQLYFDQKPGYPDPHLDLCQILNEVEDNFGDFARWNYEAPPRPNRRKRLSIALYPIHIGISPLASERDVLDFVKKRWPVIRDCLDIYQEKPLLIRKKRKAPRDEFIWEHKDIPSKKLADMVCEEFPGEVLTYADINAIKQYLRKRHSRL